MNTLEFYMGQQIRHLRKKNKLSQEKFAKKIAASQTVISRLERGLKVRPKNRQEYVRRIFTIFGPIY